MPEFSAVTIRPTTTADALAWSTFLAREQARTYADLAPAAFAQDREDSIPQAAAELADMLEDGAHRVVQAEAAGQIVGIAAAGPSPSRWEVSAGYLPAPGDQALKRLYLHPDHHGTGLADQLMDAVVLPGPVYLWLIDGNARAERYYRRRGFALLEGQFVAGESWGGLGMHRLLRP